MQFDNIVCLSAFTGAGRGLTATAPWSGVPIRPAAPPTLGDQDNFPSLGAQPPMPPPGFSGIGRGNPIAGIGRGAPVTSGLFHDFKVT